MHWVLGPMLGVITKIRTSQEPPGVWHCGHWCSGPFHGQALPLPSALQPVPVATKNCPEAGFQCRLQNGDFLMFVYLLHLLSRVLMEELGFLKLWFLQNQLIFRSSTLIKGTDGLLFHELLDLWIHDTFQSFVDTFGGGAESPKQTPCPARGLISKP